MLIRVRHSHGKIEEVSPKKLQKLIESRKIVQFFRSDNWVTVGIERTRNAGDENYGGPERRRSVRSF